MESKNSQLEVIRYSEDIDAESLYYQVIKGDKKIFTALTEEQANTFCMGYLIGNNDIHRMTK